MSEYAKSIAAFVGLLAIVSKDFFGVEIGSVTTDEIIKGLMALGTVFAVYQARNS